MTRFTFINDVSISPLPVVFAPGSSILLPTVTREFTLQLSEQFQGGFLQIRVDASVEHAPVHLY